MINLDTKTKIMLVTAIVAIITLSWTVNTGQASIDYWMKETQSFGSYGEHHVSVNCKNGGNADGSFYLNVTFVNASFSHKTDRPYTTIDNSSVKLKYLLHEGGSAEKWVYFTIDEGVTSFSIHLTYENIDFFQKGNPIYATTLAYEWSDTTNSYQLV